MALRLTAADLPFPSPSSPVSTPDDEEKAKIHRRVMRMFDAARKYRQSYDKDWLLYYRVYTGSHWPDHARLYLDWKARITVNHTFAIIEKEVAIMTDQQPRVEVVPPNATQAKYVAGLQAAVDDVYESEGMPEYKLADFCKNALIYGISWLKSYWDPDARDGQGAIRIDLCDPFEIFIDPRASCEDDAEYMLWVRRMSLSKAKRIYPDHAEEIDAANTEPDPRIMRLTQATGYAQTQATADYADMTLESPVSDDPRIIESSPTRTPPFLTGRADATSVTVIEAWSRDYSEEEVEIPSVKGGTITVTSQRYAHNMRLTTLVGKAVIQDDSTPYEHEMFPFIRLIDNSLPGEVYSIGEIANLWPLQKEINKRRSLLADAATYMGNPIWVADEDAMVNTNTLTNQPGLIVKKARGTDVHRMPGVEIPAGMFQLAMIPTQEMKEISGIQEAAFGRPPRGVRSGVAIEALQEASLGVLRSKVRHLKGALRRLGRLIIAYVQQFYTTQRMIRISPFPGEVAFIPFHGGWIEGDWGLRIIASATTNSSKQERFNKYLQLYQLGLVDKEAVLQNVDVPDKEQIMERMKIQQEREQMQMQQQQQQQQMQMQRQQQQRQQQQPLSREPVMAVGSNPMGLSP